MPLSINGSAGSRLLFLRRSRVSSAAAQRDRTTLKTLRASSFLRGENPKKICENPSNQRHLRAENTSH